MKNQRRVEIPNGKVQEGKRFRGRFSILVLISVVNVVSVVKYLREGNLRAAASPPRSMWLSPREVRRLATMTWVGKHFNSPTYNLTPSPPWQRQSQRQWAPL